MHPLLQQLIDRHGLPVIDTESYPGFIADAAPSVVFFAEDPARYPETADVACVLPEIIKAFPGLRSALVAAEHEDALQAQYDFSRWPTLAFFREGRYLGAISGIQNWEDYLQRIQALLTTDHLVPVINL